MKVTEQTIIGDILDFDSACEKVFLSMDMDCMNCPSSRGETLEEACAIHQVDMQELLIALNDYFSMR